MEIGLKIKYNKILINYSVETRVPGEQTTEGKASNWLLEPIQMEQGILKNVNNLNTNIYSYFETSGGQSYNLYWNVVHFFNTRVN